MEWISEEDASQLLQAMVITAAVAMTPKYPLSYFTQQATRMTDGTCFLLTPQTNRKG